MTAVQTAQASTVAEPQPLRLEFRFLRAVVLALLTGATAFLGRQSGVLDGKIGLAFLAVVVLAVPTSRQLSRRILLAACLAAGYIPVLWWWPLPVGGVGRITLLLTVVTASLGAWVGMAFNPTSRIRRLMPKLAPVDAIPPLLAILGAAALYPWLQPKSGFQALSLLMTGWDNSAHFSMVHMIRTYGVTVDMIAPSPSGGSWQFATYPQGFHALATAVVETILGPRVRDLGLELVAYTHAVAIITILACISLVAGLCALPSLRRRPVIAAPIAAFVAAVFFFGPASNAIQEGFTNFVFACALVGAAALVGVPMARAVSPLHVGALVGAMVGIANGWILLLVPAAPVAVMAALPLRRGRWAVPTRYGVATTVIVLVGLACVIRAVVVVARLPVGNPLVLTGGIVQPDMGVVVAAVLGALALCSTVGCLSKVGRGTLSSSAVRARTLSGVPLIGIAAAAVLAAMQISANGQVSYYGLKFITGLEIICLVLLSIAAAFILSSWRRDQTVAPVRTRRPGVTMHKAAISLTLSIAATQSFGFAVPGLASVGLPATAAGVANRSEQVAAINAPTSATGVLRAASLQSDVGDASVFYFNYPSDNKVHPIAAAQWYFALTNTWTRQLNTVAGELMTETTSISDLAAEIRELFLTRPEAFAAVPADQVEAVRDVLELPWMSDHVIGW
ncbi:hypothetical protein [Pseudonocardia acidicola]|uniref:Beta-carotene 15,15'-monooxygenase n=1 Tax=Pseudonocardia acidicola TaxID=2724939 RepID=A0ABX1SJ28_9PSEU|nr:hypothetical protein [Pseudonocardia acidicola]NMI01556.1 hypothetical protein [Pseudonocardia acidicola]